ncbi:uncharacterized protein BO66DRAFT_346048 [Aspergillus aculeatinus CBS 121060]|uniref:Uncharacterized protein n=1 Tax=Aspergillus aculeatinus CBS 121060 TaxID=1448322 RepID=A0ACD1HEP2_9EURO|nr:hypothetical protein BO66DRAFT_346048 [Aspergillus aculeatinus CBS 121060]RAH71942.1 hypothetical protein BO66DRAFT_346048 [Aspergillus aculeatinus CBS 121060]
MGHSDYKRDPESLRDTAPKRPWWTPFSLCLTFLCLCLLRVIIVPHCFGRWSFSWGILPRLGKNSSLAPFYAYSEGSGEFDKPQGFDIVALVPFRHWQRTEILNCYLQNNLVSNHGLVDQVVFLPQTNDTRGLEWLASIVEQNPLYTLAQGGPGSQLDRLKKDTLYIWIDGDIVFLEDHTISTVVKTKLEHPGLPLVSANVINEAALEALHSHASVALPYLPELSPTQSSSEADMHDWRASHLPPWQGPNYFTVKKEFAPPFISHRWLLSGYSNYSRTPISMSKYAPEGPSMHHWTVNAQQHYSFLHHLELNHLNRYKFPTWSVPSTNVSLNFLCFWGSVATGRLLTEFDGMTFLETLADDQRGKISIIDGKGLAVHYLSSQGPEGLDSTDLLKRYQSFAEEAICKGI